jgi:hypothetical protein
MISVLLETGGARPSTGAVIAVASMIGYTLAASVVAGAASPGAGLGVIALGLLAATIADFALWREVAFRDVETVDLVAEPVPALAAPAPMPAMIEATPQAIPA